jgi:hypothetical protein
MADNLDGKSNNLLLGVLLGAAVVALGVLAYFYYERRHEPVVKIDVPGFSGEIRKDNGGVHAGIMVGHAPLCPPYRYGTSTAAPVSSPWRKRSSASLAAARGIGTTVVFTPAFGASARNSRASSRVRLATERTTRSSHRIS